MSSALLPPLPALIPIASLRKSPPSSSCNNNNNNSGATENGGHTVEQQCTPCCATFRVMGEQRPRRPGRQPVSSVELIDNARSRGTSAAPQSRKIRPERHRKSDKRRDRRRRATTQNQNLNSKNNNNNNNIEAQTQTLEHPVNPRVNPIFVWVRQEDTRIVEVKCEDYDKRNRILLTKTPQGWRATPRTETHVHSQKEEADKKQHHHHHHHHHHHRNKKSKKHKTKQKSTSIQADENNLNMSEEDDDNAQNSPIWESPSDVETLLPSHTIHVRKNTQSLVNSDDVVESAQQQSDKKCSVDPCDEVVSPLDNLLAVAELELGQWKSPSETQQQELDETELKNLIDSCSKENNEEEEENKSNTSVNFIKEETDYTEDDENNMAMDDILSRLEQSLESPQTPKNTQPDIKEEEEEQHHDDDVIEIIEEKPEADEVPTDLSLKHKSTDLTIEIPELSKNDEFEQPTDLSIPKSNTKLPSPNNVVENVRPQSQNSEALQSPQPSGIPAVPPSPDILMVSPSSNSKKSNFLETLLANSSPKMALNSEVTIERQKEPLDLGKNRKSASPTITSCSEDVKTSTYEPPPQKKQKTTSLTTNTSSSSSLSCDPITLKTLLDNVIQTKKLEEKQHQQDSQKLLELLNEAQTNPVVQLQQLLSDKILPDPMLVPKDKLSRIIANPGREIPELLSTRPELRLPEALAFPHLLQDPDILVITLEQLETIVKKQNSLEKQQQQQQQQQQHQQQPVQEKTKKASKRIEETVKAGHAVRDFDRKNNELDVDFNHPALNPMLWLPYMNQMEAMSQFNNVAAATSGDFMKMLANLNAAPTTFPAQTSDLSHLLNNNRFPTPPTTNFPATLPPHPYGNPLEMQMWQEAMLQQANLLPRNNTTIFKDIMEKMNYKNVQHKKMNQFFPTTNNPYIVPNFKPSPSQTQHYPTFPKNQQQHHHHHKSSQKTSSTTSSSYVRNQDAQQHGTIRTKPAYKLMSKQNEQHQKEPLRQPMDLSGGTTTINPRLKVKHQQQLMDPNNQHYHRKLFGSSRQYPQQLQNHHQHHHHQEDVAEVGSTTASIEEMQEAHKHLWHPLFGNEKGYNNPWNWTTPATAMAE